jgi:hypothetical protein
MATAKKAAKSKAATKKPATKKSAPKKTAAKKVATKKAKKPVAAKKAAVRKVIPKKSAAKSTNKKIAATSKRVGKSAKTSTSTAVAVVRKVTLKNSNNQTRVEEWEIAESEKEAVIRGWARRLVETKNKMRQVNEQYKKLMLDFLQEAYAVYVEIENSEYADDFFAEIRWQLKTDEIKIQSNTPNAGLVVRFVCGSDIATKTISDYSRVLEGARRNEISPTTFSEWVKSKTMTKVIADERAANSNAETYADRLKRARLVVLRALEARETKPLISQKTTAWAAEKMLSRDGLWLAIGNARRRFDRESFYADINILAMLTPNIDLEIYIVNQLAKPFVSNVEKYEALINETEEKVWADELWEMLVSAGDEESKKADFWWANKQQASRFEDEGEFRDFVKSRKKMK